mmetsp:Transcript_81216/g.218410  ORF Transcript_81216/g.218410 Transcript_81216/m.218410 type:complete len:247 (+) Transcript_81216:276-1016(+)
MKTGGTVRRRGASGKRSDGRCHTAPLQLRRQGSTLPVHTLHRRSPPLVRQQRYCGAVLHVHSLLPYLLALASGTLPITRRRNRCDGGGNNGVGDLLPVEARDGHRRDGRDSNLPEQQPAPQPPQAPRRHQQREDRRHRQPDGPHAAEERGGLVGGAAGALEHPHELQRDVDDVRVSAHTPTVSFFGCFKLELTLPEQHSKSKRKLQSEPTADLAEVKRRRNLTATVQHFQVLRNSKSCRVAARRDD